MLTTSEMPSRRHQLPRTRRALACRLPNTPSPSKTTACGAKCSSTESQTATATPSSTAPAAPAMPTARKALPEAASAPRGTAATNRIISAPLARACCTRLCSRLGTKNLRPARPAASHGSRLRPPATAAT